VLVALGDCGDDGVVGPDAGLLQQVYRVLHETRRDGGGGRRE
jgi:hypothetical protein